MWLVLWAGVARAEPTAEPFRPLAVGVECQSEERVPLCTFLRGFLDENDVFALVPRAEAEVIVHVNATSVANDDLVHLRMVATIPDAPEIYVQDGTVDSRLGVEEQRAALAPILWRGLAPFVAVRDPDAMTVTYEKPSDEADEDALGNSPLGVSFWGGGWGSWSDAYQELSTWTGASISLLTDRDGIAAWGSFDRSVSRQPSLAVNGQDVPLVSDAFSVEGQLSGAHNVTEHWSVGFLSRTGHDDPEGQFLATTRAHVGVEHDWFPSDDPRGNVLAVAYLVGVQADWYNQVNAIGETEAVFPTHMLLASGSVRVDDVDLELDLSAQGELLRPDRRYALSASGNVDLNLGDHVDFSTSLGVTQQAIPGPGDLDLSSFEEVTRASYAEPLQAWGHVNLRVHFDATNRARNNRWDSPSNLDATQNL